ncbi:phage portal protein [Saccharothrix lopnurensis]|uniref:Phage portal protein n=1 Tax=Saccharothrix lopnurensis TaxID=1670621 RepID=A0ABW1P1N9_9PSEU
MSLFSRRSVTWPDAGQLVAERTAGRTGAAPVTTSSAMRNSAVWAAVRLRADLLSTMPVDVFRKVGPLHVEVPTPPVLTSPDGPIDEWLYMSQQDLDRAGNCFGIITAVDGLGLPARIELQDLAEVTVRVRDGRVARYRIGRQWYEPHQVWHERQFPVAGFPLGLSPVAHAALTLQQTMSAQQFAVAWFTQGGMPSVALKNTAKTLNKEQSADIKAHYKATVGQGDVFVHGSDWDLKPINATVSTAAFVESQQAGIPDIARFLGVPADLIDAAVSGQSVTYANIGQRNLQFLIMNLGPAVRRRERALSTLTPRPRTVKLNSKALLRMDPETQARVIDMQVKGRLLAPSEARELDNRPPFTPEQLEEFDRLWGRPNTKPSSGGNP